MNGHILSDTNIAVDYWKVKGRNDKLIHFLTHLHGDHIVGLTSSWQRPVYCSEFTSRLLTTRHGLPRSLLRICTLNESMIVSEPGSGSFTVTAYDANHCPGAVMFYFQGAFGNILYTGDFRASCHVIDNVRHLVEGYVDTLYLDNTFCSPRCVFPSRDECLHMVISIIRQYPMHDILIGVRNLGKESLLAELGVSLNEAVGVSPACYQVSQMLFTTNVFTTATARIRTVPMHTISCKFLDQLNTTRPTIAIIPSAIYTGLDCEPFHRNANIFVVPYSDHSSYAELMQFVSVLRPVRVRPIVEQLRGPFGVNISDRQDMTCFQALLWTDSSRVEDSGLYSLCDNSTLSCQLSVPHTQGTNQTDALDDKNEHDLSTPQFTSSFKVSRPCKQSYLKSYSRGRKRLARGVIYSDSLGSDDLPAYSDIPSNFSQDTQQTDSNNTSCCTQVMSQQIHTGVSTHPTQVKSHFTETGVSTYPTQVKSHLTEKGVSTHPTQVKSHLTETVVSTHPTQVKSHLTETGVSTYPTKVKSHLTETGVSTRASQQQLSWDVTRMDSMVQPHAAGTVVDHDNDDECSVVESPGMSPISPTTERWPLGVVERRHGIQHTDDGWIVEAAPDDNTCVDECRYIDRHGPYDQPLTDIDRHGPYDQPLTDIDRHGPCNQSLTDIVDITQINSDICANVSSSSSSLSCMEYQAEVEGCQSGCPPYTEAGHSCMEAHKQGQPQSAGHVPAADPTDILDTFIPPDAEFDVSNTLLENLMTNTSAEFDDESAGGSSIVLQKASEIKNRLISQEKCACAHDKVSGNEAGINHSSVVSRTFASLGNNMLVSGQRRNPDLSCMVKVHQELNRSRTEVRPRVIPTGCPSRSLCAISGVGKQNYQTFDELSNSCAVSNCIVSHTQLFNRSSTSPSTYAVVAEVKHRTVELSFTSNYLGQSSTLLNHKHTNYDQATTRKSTPVSEFVFSLKQFLSRSSETPFQ